MAKSSSYKIHYKLEVEIEVNCCADKFYWMYSKEVLELPKCLPHIYKGVKVIEGDGIGVGTVKLWHFVLHDGQKTLTCKERMTVVDDEKRIIKLCIIEGDVLKDYKSFDISLVVTPKENGNDTNGSSVKWCVEYEKMNEDSPPPISYLDYVERITKDLNAYLVKHAHEA